jgi:hypothetical protein
LLHKQAAQIERPLRRYLSQQPVAVLSIIMRVLRVGTGEVKAADALSLVNPTRSERLDHLVDAMVAEVLIADYLERGVSQLAEQAIDVDSLMK